MQPPAKPQPEPHTPWHWLLHTVHWGDAPTWSAAVVGATAAVFAACAFKLQNRQVTEQRDQLKKLAKQQVLTDRLLAYQAHAYARLLIAGIGVEWGSTDHPGRRLVRLGNKSQTSITELEITATLGGIPCILLAPIQDFDAAGAGASMAHPHWIPTTELTPDNCLGPIRPQTAREWTVHADNAPVDSHLKLSLKFTDEVGGRWEIDENGQARLTDGPAY